MLVGDMLMKNQRRAFIMINYGYIGNNVMKLFSVLYIVTSHTHVHGFSCIL